ncbi:hypothetical protein GCM10010236_10340 [Streptomyces eurythermus]|nr:hypothetical protein GCM10010236_10340 [Streptomyces eurythermus]
MLPEHLVGFLLGDEARTTRVGHATCPHSYRKERWAFSASERTITSRSKRGHHPSSRSSSPAAQPAPTGAVAASLFGVLTALGGIAPIVAPWPAAPP